MCEELMVGTVISQKSQHRTGHTRGDYLGFEEDLFRDANVVSHSAVAFPSM